MGNRQCAEWFPTPNTSGTLHGMPCVAFLSSRSVRNVFRCACERGRQRLLLRKDGSTHADCVEEDLSIAFRGRACIDRYPPVTLSEGVLG